MTHPGPGRIIGLTGGIGSGKSTVARLFEALGIDTVDADDVGREVVRPGEPALDAIREHFGDDVILPEGGLDRPALRQRVFADPAERRWLERLLHPLIRERLRQHLSEARSPYALLVSPLLLETDQHQLCDRVVVVDVPPEVQIARTMARDDNSREQVERIMAAQMDRQARLERADEVIDNSRPVEEVEAQVKNLHQRLLP